MQFANPLPWWLIVALVAGSAALAWLAYRHFNASAPRRLALVALRLLTLLVLIVLLMRPVARTDAADTRDVIVPILVDASRSMGIEDAGGQRRIDHARDLVSRSCRCSNRVSKWSCSRSATGCAAAAAACLPARRSDLGALATVRERYRGRAVAIVLLSDGGDTGGARRGSPRHRDAGLRHRDRLPRRGSRS
jgi:hypothetical protein